MIVNKSVRTSKYIEHYNITIDYVKHDRFNIIYVITLNN